MIRFQTSDTIHYIKQENIKLLECPIQDDDIGKLEMVCGQRYSLKGSTLFKVLAQMKDEVNAKEN